MKRVFFLFILCCLTLTGVDLFSQASPKTNVTKESAEATVSLRVIYPSAPGIILEAGSYVTITWIAVGQIDKVELRYSTNNGLDYPHVITSIVSAGSLPGSHVWQVPITTTPSAMPNVKVKIISLKDNNIYGESDKAFLIRGKIALNTIFGSGADRVWVEGEIHAISWTTIGIVEDIKLEYSINDFSQTTPTCTWEILDHQIANVSNGNTFYNWTIPGKISNSINFRISGKVDSCVYCVSNHFQIVGKDIGEMEVTDAIRRIEKNISAVRTVQSVFIQEKRLAVFNDKITLKGRIYLKKPDSFAWHVNTPLKYSIVVTGDLLSQWDEDSDQVQVVSLAKNSGVQILVTELRKWLSAKYTDLATEYSAKLRSKSPLVLEFSPKETSMAYKLINHVVVSFTENESYITQILIDEKSGDSSLLIFSDTKLNEEIDSNAWNVKNYGR